MNRNKKTVIKLLIAFSLYSVATGISQMIHKSNTDFNADKFKVKSKSKTKVVKVVKPVKRDNYNNFMKLVNIEKSKILKKQILRKERIKQQELKRELIAKQKDRQIKIANERKRERESEERLNKDKGNGGVRNISENVNKNISKSRGESRGSYDTTFTLSFYTSLDGDITSSGSKARNGYCASNVIEQGTNIELEGYGIQKVMDTGGGNFNTSNRLDIFVERLSGESDSEYNNRVEKMGMVTVKGKIIK